MYKLYTFARSSTAWRARIALHLKGIQAEQIYVHLFKGEQRSDNYKKLNPNMGVPTLILPDGTPLIQSMAIIEYLNQVHPHPHDLFPNPPALRAQVRGFCQVINSGLHPYQNLRLLQKLQKDYGAKKDVWLSHWLKKGTSTLEQMLVQNKRGGRYVFGDEITCADVFLYPQIYNAKNRFNLDLTPFPNVTRIFNALALEKAFQDSAPEKQKDFD